MDAAPWGLAADTTTVAALAARDEAAFARLVDHWASAMFRVARSHVSTDASAEEVVQDTWLAVLRGLDRFEGRSSLRTWVFRILVNTAKTRGVRERRTVPMSALAPADAGPTVDPDRFRGPDDAYPGGWKVFPAPWPSPDHGILGDDARTVVVAAIAGLPDRQRAVVTLRDVHGFEADEVCTMLDLSSGNQRVLLHRGRAAVRARLERHFGETARWGATP
jgi:RNA polymerase sigma-70 factor, ECF subfamily